MLLSTIEKVQPFLTPKSAGGVALLLALLIFRQFWNGQAWTTRRSLSNLRRVRPSKRNMLDQHDAKYAAPEGSTPTDLVRIKAIFIHPVKSCAPVEVDSATVTKAGLLYDRVFSFAVNAEDKKSDEKAPGLQFISQRVKPKLSLIQTELWLPHDNSDVKDWLVNAGGAVRLSFPDPDPASIFRRLKACVEQLSLRAVPMYYFVVPLAPTIRHLRETELEPMPFTIHSREAHGINMGGIRPVADAMPKLKRLLGYPERRTLTLFKCTPDTLTPTDRNLAPLANIGTRAVHGYTDQQPIHINSVASVQAVSEHLPEENKPLDALRFRANLWITGAPAYEEDSWKRCRIVPVGATKAGEVKLPTTLSVVCRTSRCTIPNVEPAKGAFSTQQPPEGKKMGAPQPSTTLVEHRTVENGNRKALGYLGMHAVPEDRDLNKARKERTELVVRVGDEIEVLERGDHLYGSTGDMY